MNGGNSALNVAISAKYGGRISDYRSTIRGFDNPRVQ